MKTTRIKFFMGTILLLLMGIFFPLYSSGFSNNWEDIIFYLICLYSTLKLSSIILVSKVRILEATFYSYVYVFLGITPIISIAQGYFPWRNAVYPSELINYTGLIILMSLLFYDFGIIFVRFRKNKKKENQSENIYDRKKYTLEASKGKFLVFLFGCLFLSLIALYYRGGLETIFLPRNLGVSINDTGMDSGIGQIITALYRVPLFISFIFLIIMYKNDKGNKKLLILLVFFGVLTLIFNNPISNSRYWVGTVYLSILLFLIGWKKNIQPIYVSLLLFTLIIVFPYADIFRNSLDIELNIEPITYMIGNNGDYDSFQQIMNVINYTRFNDITFGRQLLGVIFFWVPRAVWPTKPIGTGATVAYSMGMAHTNVSAPLWSEFYINFGLLGVILMFFFYGYITEKLQAKFSYYIITQQLSAVRLFVPIFSVYQLFLLRGDLLSSVANLVPVIIFIQLGLSTVKQEKVKSKTIYQKIEVY